MDNPIVNGLFVFILGLLVVFFGMIIIITAVTICGKIFASTETKPQKKVEEPAIEQVKPTTESEELPEHVKVAIIAAISAYYFNAQSKCDFVVKKIKRI